MDEQSKILVVEDDSTIRTILGMALDGAGFKDVEMAGRGDDGLEADTRFSGTRADPSLRGCYRGIDENNLTPGHLARATLRGIVNEMKAGYDAIEARLDARPARLIGSGNAVRKNAAMRSILSETFGLTLTLGPCEEDAAYGAALFALGGLETSSPD